VVVSPALLQLCEERGRGVDGGRAFFEEFAAKQMAIYRGLGFRGAYLGGVYQFAATQRILDIERSFSPDDWKQFAREISFSRPGEYFYYEANSATGLADRKRPAISHGSVSRHLTPTYWLAKKMHATMFTPGTALSRWGAKVCAGAADPKQGPAPLRALEHVSKAALFRCKDCGDCSLPEIAFLCPESQCAKNQRNGPCGGTRDGRCEVDGYGDCIWLRAYERIKHDGCAADLLTPAVVVQDQSLRGTSSWANFWLGRDHVAQRPSPASPASADTAPISSDHAR
jgi:methylenetetrahydrofolate reductase (NADPH)